MLPPEVLRAKEALAEADVAHLRRILRQSGAAARDLDPEQVIAAAEGMAGELRKFRPPDYVMARVELLERLGGGQTLNGALSNQRVGQLLEPMALLRIGKYLLAQSGAVQFSVGL